MSADETLREAIERLADEHEQVMDSLVPMPNREERESGRRLVRRLHALLAEHPATPTEEPADALDFIRRLVGAWDCCGTCAGGVLARHDAALTAKAKAEGWDEGRRFGQIHWASNYWPEVKHRPDPNPYRERADREPS